MHFSEDTVFEKGVFDTQSPPSAFSPHYSVTLFNVGSHCTAQKKNLLKKKHVYVLGSQHKAQYIMRAKLDTELTLGKVLLISYYGNF